MKIKPFRAHFPRLDKIESPDLFCSEAKNLFRKYVEDELYLPAAGTYLYVYQIETKTGRHTGLVSLNEVEDFFAGKVKKHEATLSEREKHQLELFLRWGAVLKPVLLTYPPVAAINDWLEQYARKHRPVLSAKFKGNARHRVWAVHDGRDISRLQELFAKHVQGVYIADGHHRTSTMALLHEQRADYPAYDFDHLFCAFFPADQLDILDYNRVVEVPKGMSGGRFVASLSRLFEIEPLSAARRPEDKHEITMLFRKEWYSLHWRAEILEKAAQKDVVLDATLLNERVLYDILNISDVRSDARVSYIDGSKGIEGLKKAVQGRNRVGFALYPVHIADLMRLADAGESLPPKSTYFEPRLKSGLIVQPLKR
jgi:uncharacterized protein (DUF1015 family)